jgi:hypothetical protein
MPTADQQKSIQDRDYRVLLGRSGSTYTGKCCWSRRAIQPILASYRPFLLGALGHVEKR